MELVIGLAAVDHTRRELDTDVRLQTKVQEIESLEANKPRDGRLMVHSSNTGYGEKQTMKADMVVHSWSTSFLLSLA